MSQSTTPSTTSEHTHNPGRQRIHIGDYVVDTDDNSDSRDRAVVVNCPPVPASEWYVYNNRTVADDNPAYDESTEIAIIIFESDLETAYPSYTGAMPIKLKKLERDNVPYYAFPRTRLAPVGELSTKRTIDLTDIRASPFHSRTFSYEANESFINEIQERGYPDPIPVVRDCGTYYEIVNGHKRIWASHIAGVTEIPCHCTYLSDHDAAAKWATRHLPGYNDEQTATAIERLEDAFNQPIEQIVPEHVLTE